MSCALEEFLVKKNINYFKNYLDFIESSIKDGEKRIRQEEEMINKLVAEKGEVIDDVDDYLACLDEDNEKLKQIMYQSFVISIFAFTEAKITNIQKRQNEFFVNTELKNKFGVAKGIRNMLLHEEGKIFRTERNQKKKEEKAKVKDFIVRHPDYLEINESGKIIIKFEYVKSLIVFTQNVCTELLRLTRKT